MPDWRACINRMLYGDQVAADAFFRHWHRWIISSVRNALRGNPADAEDVASDVVVKLARHRYRALAEWRGMDDDAANSERSLAGYLRRICVNEARDFYRAAQRNSANSGIMDDILADACTEPEAWTAGARMAQVVLDCLSQLSEADREILELKFSERLTLSEMGERLGIAANAAGQRVNRAERRLHARIAGIAPDELRGLGR
jgi:RNA polymerase sigma factor (sigma-70 family)